MKADLADIEMGYNPQIFSYPQHRRPITPSLASLATKKAGIAAD